MRYKLLKNCTRNKSTLGYIFIIIDIETLNSTMLLQSPEKCFKYLGEKGLNCKAGEKEFKDLMSLSWNVLEEFETILEIKDQYPEWFI
jgi:hypothetical protein